MDKRGVEREIVEFKAAPSDEDLKRVQDQGKRRAILEESTAKRRNAMPAKLSAEDYAGPGGGKRERKKERERGDKPS